MNKIIFVKSKDILLNMKFNKERFNKKSPIHILGNSVENINSSQNKTIRNFVTIIKDNLNSVDKEMLKPLLIDSYNLTDIKEIIEHELPGGYNRIFNLLSLGAEYIPLGFNDYPKWSDKSQDSYNSLYDYLNNDKFKYFVGNAFIDNIKNYETLKTNINYIEDILDYFLNENEKKIFKEKYKIY